MGTNCPHVPKIRSTVYRRSASIIACVCFGLLTRPELSAYRPPRPKMDLDSKASPRVQSNPETGTASNAFLSLGPQQSSKLISPQLAIAGASLPSSALEINGDRQSSMTATERKPLCVAQEPISLPLPAGSLHGKTCASAAPHSP